MHVWVNEVHGIVVNEDKLSWGKLYFFLLCLILFMFC